MIAIPLDDKHATTISYEYVKAPFFALLDTLTGYFKVIENTKKDGLIVNLLYDNGANMTVCHTMDELVSESCTQRGVSVYEVPRGTVSLDQIYEDASQKRGLFA